LAASWHYIGRVDQVAKAGDFLTGRVGEVPVVIVCDDGARSSRGGTLWDWDVRGSMIGKPLLNSGFWTVVFVL
jgi:hypothetical protein